MHYFLKFILGIELYMFRTLPLSIIRSPLQAQAVSITCMTYTYCCVYSTGLLMMDRGTVRNM